MRTNRRTVPAAEIKPASVLEALDLGQIFGRTAPLEVDLGCGDGSFLVELARQNPERNFIGIERMPGRVRSAARKIGASNLTNARILEHEILPALQQFFLPQTVDRFHLLFPDPWPKRRHHSRRVFDQSFLRAITRALRFGGALRLATDDAEYFAAIKSLLAETTQPLVAVEDDSPLPATTFESHFRSCALPICWLNLIRTSGIASPADKKRPPSGREKIAP